MPRRANSNALEARINQIVQRAARAISEMVRGVGARVAAPAGPAEKGGVGRRRRRGRRGPNALTLDKIVRLLESHPGLRSEQIRDQLGLDGEVVRQGLTKLRASSKVKTKGERRATAYFVS